MRVAVVEHQESCPPALFGAWLSEAGAELHVVRPYAGDHLPDLRAYDAVLVLGGEMSANDDETVAWLGPLKRAIRDLVGTGTPLLGICLGHQLIAAALGGTVAKNPQGQTVGLVPVGWAADAGADALFAAGPSEARAIHWNDDIVVVPPAEMTVLATTPGGDLQAARFGPGAWGVQAHPEAHGDVVRVWAAGDRDDHLALGIDQDAALAAIDTARAELDDCWRPVAQRFAEIARERATQA